MKAYVISLVTVHDEEPLAELRKGGASSRIIHAHGGRYLTKHQPSEWYEGEIRPERIGIMEFPSLQHARDYVTAPEFKEWTAERSKYADAMLVVVEGVDDPDA